MKALPATPAHTLTPLRGQVRNGGKEKRRRKSVLPSAHFLTAYTLSRAPRVFKGYTRSTRVGNT